MCSHFPKQHCKCKGKKKATVPVTEGCALSQEQDLHVDTQLVTYWLHRETV